MTRLNNYLILMAFFLATIIATISAIAEEPLTQCGKHIGSYCGKQILDKLMGHDKSVVSTDCCYKLIQTGYPCHIKVTLYILHTNAELKKANWTEFVAKSDKIFDKCDLLTKPGSPEFLARCTENLGSHCGEQVYNKLINDKKITKHCCEKLVEMGQTCHVSMAKALIRTPEMRDVDAIQLMNKNKKIFDYCLHVE